MMERYLPRWAVVVSAGFILTALLLGLRAPARAAGPWYVAPGGNDANSCLSAGSPCATINGAIGKASSGDTIYVATGTYTASAGSAVVLIDRNVTLSGGWNGAFTAQSGMSSIGGGQGAQLGIAVNGGVTAIVGRFVIQNGTSNFDGGGIANSGTLTLNSSTVNGNTAQRGGGIANSGTLTLNSSTVNGNTAEYFGGGIYNSGNLTLNNSTVSSNTAQESGGIFNAGMLSLNNATVSNNSARNRGGLDTSAPAATAVLQNSILSGNTVLIASPDCYGAIDTLGYNLIGNSAGCIFTPGTGDLTSVDPKLGSLIGLPAYHPLMAGSPAINAGNPGGCTGSTGALTADQRGAPRSGRCDMGAYEYTAPGAAASIMAMAGTPQRTPPLSVFAFPFQVLVLDSIGSPVGNATVTFTAPSGGASGVFADSKTYTTTAATDASGFGVTAKFTANGIQGIYMATASVSGVITPATFSLSNIGWYVAPAGNDSNNCQTSATPCATINGVLAKGSFVANDTVLVGAGTYTGTGYEGFLLDEGLRLLGGWNSDFTFQGGTSTIDGQGVRRGMTIVRPGDVAIERFAFQNGSASSGGGLYNEGRLSLNNSLISGNTASGGGGIYNASGGSLTLNYTIVSGNTASGGGGIYSEWQQTNVAVNNSIIRGNAATSAGGIYSGGVLVINNSAIISNTASGTGGGIRSSGYVIINNSTISGNTASHSPFPCDDCVGGIFSSGRLILNNVTLSDNTADTVGGLFNQNSSVALQNTIVAGNIGGISPDCMGSINSSGYNLIGDTAGCNYIPGTGDVINVNAKLGPLEGAPGFQPLQGDSPALNAGNPSGCMGSAGLLATDQRGYPRFGRCDIGAYEAQPIAYSVKTANKSLALPGVPVTYMITLSNPGGSNLSNVLVTDTLPVSLAYNNNSLTATGGSYGYASGVITWTGSVNTGTSVTISFGTTVGQVPIGTVITNSGVIQGAGELLTRTAAIAVDYYRVYAPLTLRKFPRGIHGRVTLTGTPAAGVPLELRFFNGSAWSTLAATTTDADGEYSFLGVPGLMSGQRYYVRYRNTAGTPGRLWVWATRHLTAYAAGNDIEIGNFDLADIALTAPSDGATVGLPYTFQWTPRPATPSDTYEFNLYDWNDFDPYFYTAPPLGYVGSFTLNSLPPGFSPGAPYAWDLWVYSPDGGYGISYETRVVRFSNTGLGAAQASASQPLPRKPADLLEDLPER